MNMRDWGEIVASIHDPDVVAIVAKYVDDEDEDEQDEGWEDWEDGDCCMCFECGGGICDSHQ